jgi:Putative MetA-pathway of phenol degradation
MLTHRITITALLAICFCLLPIDRACSQDVEPRRWTALPVGINVVGFGYGYSTGDIAFDPVLLVEDATLDLDTLVITYARTFGLLGRSARFDMVVPWQHGTWEGLLDGVPARAVRTGLADPQFRLSINLYGAPAVGMEEFKKRAMARPVNTVIGAGIMVSVPLGEYFEDKLLNLGQNRYIIRPQIGVLHTRGLWSYELTGSTYLYTDNDEFFGGNELEREPIRALQAHIIRVFKPGLWASLSAAYGWRGESTVNGVASDNDKSDYLLALSFGFPLTRSQGVKLVYMRSQTRRITGANLDTLALAWSIRF